MYPISETLDARNSKQVKLGLPKSSPSHVKDKRDRNEESGHWPPITLPNLLVNQ